MSKEELEKRCENCLARGWWEGEHNCPPWLAMLVKMKKEDVAKITNNQ